MKTRSPVFDPLYFQDQKDVDGMCELLLKLECVRMTLRGEKVDAGATNFTNKHEGLGRQVYHEEHEDLITYHFRHPSFATLHFLYFFNHEKHERHEKYKNEVQKV